MCSNTNIDNCIYYDGDLMADGIEMVGFEEIETLLQDMTIDEADEKKAMKKAIEPIKAGLEKDTPKGETAKLSKIKATVKKEGLSTVGIVKTDAWWDKFQEFGTSQQKRNVGYFDKSFKSTEGKALEILAKELLDKAR